MNVPAAIIRCTIRKDDCLATFLVGHPLKRYRKGWINGIELAGSIRKKRGCLTIMAIRICKWIFFPWKFPMSISNRYIYPINWTITLTF